VTVTSIDNAEKNPKEIMSWIKNVTDLHKGRPPATVNYTKKMPDFDLLMEEWPIAMSTQEYASVMLALLGIP